MKKLFGFVILFLFSFYLIACTAMGKNPSGQHLEKIVISQQYNADKEIFQNTKPITFGFPRPWYEVMFDLFFNGKNRRPDEKLPEAPPGLVELKHKTQTARFIWFGHSTILLEIEGKRILIDPVFSTYASPIPGMVKRFQAPVFEVDEINDIDIVLISHDHYDHLDYPTIVKLKDRVADFIVPLGVGSHLEYWGVDSNKIHELDWWGKTVVKDLVFTCTPAQHFSGRGIMNRNSTLWASWAIKGLQQNIYYSGDSGYSGHYKEIGERLGPFNFAFLENGAYNKDWQFVHQMPEEGVQANIDLKSNIMIPVHWGMFDLSLHTWYDPIQRVTSEAEKRGVTIIAPKLGQLVSPQLPYQQENWWQPLIDRIKP